MHDEAGKAASTIADKLINQGVVGALLAIFLAAFLWLFYRLFNKLLGEWSESMRAAGAFQAEQVKTLHALRDLINEHHREVMMEFRALHREPTHPSIQLPLPRPLPPRRG